MRKIYRSDLEGVVNELVVMSDSIQIAVRDATRALLHADLQLAERVISGDTRIDAMHDQLELRAFTILARQAPVAGELRTLVAVIQMVAALGRMGDLAAHVATLDEVRSKMGQAMYAAAAASGEGAAQTANPYARPLGAAPASHCADMPRLHGRSCAGAWRRTRASCGSVCWSVWLSR